MLALFPRGVVDMWILAPSVFLLTIQLIIFIVFTYRVNDQCSKYKYANEALRAVALPLGPIGIALNFI
jgi:hypothetical protein